MIIRQISGDSAHLMPLLLIGDESEEMIMKYLPHAKIFAASEGELDIAGCAIIDDNDWIEIKNLAVIPSRRRQGIGHKMLAYVESLYPAGKFRLGTGETPSTLHFYESCGYRYSHRIPDFFTDNYPKPIIEEGVTLKDMIYLVK